MQQNVMLMSGKVFNNVFAYHQGWFAASAFWHIDTDLLHGCHGARQTFGVSLLIGWVAKKTISRTRSFTGMSFPPIMIQTPEREQWLNQHVPYRIKMLQGPQDFIATGGRRGPLEPAFPSIFESAVIACRWSGNFLGLGYPGKIFCDR